MQIRGRKRLLLYPPDALDKLQPYPSWHILRRRCRLDPANPDLKRFPHFHKVRAGLSDLEAVWITISDGCDRPILKNVADLKSCLYEELLATFVWTCRHMLHYCDNNIVLYLITV